MSPVGSRNIQTPSKINYNYQTIKVTQSRLDKGFLAIPISISKYFPSSNTKVKLYLDETEHLQLNNFSSFTSSTNESRIGGLRVWFEKNYITDGDEIVIQILDREKFVYRLIPENLFVSKVDNFQTSIDGTKEENDINKNIENLRAWTHTNESEIYLNEYYRILNKTELDMRKKIKTKEAAIHESTPNNIRFLLGNLYHGLCQVCRFTFLKMDSTPYFEIHHLKPDLGHHPKNLILVCANCHKQFEYADVNTYYNEFGWLIEVKFNKILFKVKQAILNENLFAFKKITYF